MDFICLDGSITPASVDPRKYPKRQISKIQTAARERIKQELGHQIILEEFVIPKSQMRLDFYLPRINIAVEVQGRQHFEFVKHFHGTKKKFAAAQNRDNLKVEWCAINDIELIVWKEEDLNG